jgi:hypothetical protein
MQVHTLDTSALSELAKQPHGLVRHRLIDEIAAERIVVLGTHPLLLELAGAHRANRAHFRAMFELLIRITSRRLLLPALQRIDRELSARGPLAFPDFVDQKEGVVPFDDSAALEQGEADLFGRTRGLAFREAEQTADAARDLDDLGRRQARAAGVPFDESRWRKGLKDQFRVPAWLHDLAEHYARKTIEHRGKASGIDVSGLSPSSVPSAWSSAWIHVSRMRAVIVGGASPTGKKSPGPLDLVHLKEAASYADMFVTKDRGLLAFAKDVPGLRCEVLSFDQWARRFTA